MSTDRPQGILDQRWDEQDPPCPSRRSLDAGEPTLNTLSVEQVKNGFFYNYVNQPVIAVLKARLKHHRAHPVKSRARSCTSSGLPDQMLTGAP